jgi:hypothetical protein
MNLETVTDLTADECWQLLRRHDVARLFYRVGDLTHLTVVNHAVAGGTVFFRTVEGSDVLPAVLGREVSLELDEHHELGSRCVVVRGMALRVDEPGGREVGVEILPISVSGRRLHDGRLPASA